MAKKEALSIEELKAQVNARKDQIREIKTKQITPLQDEIAELKTQIRAAKAAKNAPAEEAAA